MLGFRRVKIEDGETLDSVVSQIVSSNKKIKYISNHPTGVYVGYEVTTPNINDLNDKIDNLLEILLHRLGLNIR